MIKLYIYKKIEITSIKKIPYLTEIFTSPDQNPKWQNSMAF